MNNRPKILFVTDTLTSGGVESQLVELATRLQHSHCHVQVACLYGDKAGHSEYFLSRLVDAGVAVDMLDLALTPKAKLTGVYDLIRTEYHFHPDIIQAENYHANLLTRLARPFMRRSVRLIGSIRGNYTPKQLRYERLSHAACNAIVANGPHLRDQLIRLAHIPAAKVHYIPCGVDLSRFEYTALKQHDVSIPMPSNRLLLAVGRIHPEKQMHLIVEAVGLLKTQNRLPDDVRLAIVGKSQDATAQALLDAAIKRYSLQGIVAQYGEVQHVEAWYAAAEFTILFSPAEGLPNVVLESLAAGRPVVISEAANAAQVVEHGITGWIVRTGDIGHLAETLSRVLRLSSHQLLDMREASLSRAVTYSMESAFSHYMSLYSQLGMAS